MILDVDVLLCLRSTLLAKIQLNHEHHSERLILYPSIFVIRRIVVTAN